MADSIPTAPCLFCDRSASDVIGETASWYIRLDNFPAAPGHVELVTKRHVESFFGLNGDESAELYGALAYARNLVEAKVGTPDAWTIGINDGQAAGQSIAHVHVHLIPRHHGDVPDPRGGIRQAAPNCNPDEWGTAPAREPNVYEANRALFEDLDRETTAARAAWDRDDMDAWAMHAGRAAQLYQEIAERLGWDTSAPRYDEEETDA